MYEDYEMTPEQEQANYELAMRGMSEYDRHQARAVARQHTVLEEDERGYEPDPFAEAEFDLDAPF